jgi:hypothetical protein
MTIRGVITTRHVLRHAAVIAREFGLVVFLRCCLVDRAGQEDDLPRVRLPASRTGIPMKRTRAKTLRTDSYSRANLARHDWIELT